MWRPEHRLQGPFPATDRDIPALNTLFTDAFTDRYRRDGLVGVRVPPLDRPIWRFALRTAGGGALLWRDDDGGVAAFNIAHRSGVEGWMGPLAVRPDRQGLGLGRSIVEAGVAWLEGGGCTTIGLETMPRTMDNIGFYARLGFAPGHLTMTLSRDVTDRPPRDSGFRLQDLDVPEAESWRERVVRAIRTATSGIDFTRECALTAELGLGDLCVVADGTTVLAAALWHVAPLTESRLADEIRVLKLYAADGRSFAAVLAALESAAVHIGIKRVSVRCQTRFQSAYHALVERGYHVRWTDLRMTLTGYPEVSLRGDTVIFSNWEI